MTLPLPSIQASAAGLPLLQLEPVNYDERWAAWQAKGKANERAVRRNVEIAASLAMIVASVVYSLFVN